MSHFFLDVNRFLEAGQNVVIARIIFQTGSAPRSTGTGCIILEDGTIIGTVGGGALEYEVQQKALSVFKKKSSQLVNFQLTGKEVAQTDMLCGGIVDVFLEPITATNIATKEIFARVKTALDNNDKATLVTRVAEGIGHDQSTARMLVVDDGASVNTFGELGADIDLDQSVLLATCGPELMVDEDKGYSVFVEPIQTVSNLYIFGGGHISTCLSPLAKTVGFGVIVIDDRQEFANPARFPDADEIIVAPFSEAFKKITINASSYVAIITRGHLHDHQVLSATLKCSPGYIGMIGSSRKREIIYKALIDEGVSEETLKEVHSPIGLDIKAETPEEIAISIVAELIQERVLAG
jgi:xanthine dehydrogenase accessory factor